MPKPKTVTVYLRVCKRNWIDGGFGPCVALKRQFLSIHNTGKCCRIIPYKLKVPKEKKK